MEYTGSYKAFCDRLRINRKLSGYNQAQIADMLEMTRVEYANKESGRSMITGKDLKRINDLGMDIDQLLVDAKRVNNSHTLLHIIQSYEGNTEREYIKGVITEHVLYMCETRVGVLSDNVAGNLKMLKAMDKAAANDDESILRCLRDVNGITDQMVISEALGITRYKYSKIENKKEYPDAMVLIGLYEQYKYLPSIYLDIYDVQIEMLDNIYDRLSHEEQEIIVRFVNSLKQFI